MRKGKFNVKRMIKSSVKEATLKNFSGKGKSKVDSQKMKDEARNGWD